VFVNLWRHCGTRRTTRTDCKGHRVQQSVSSSLLHAMRAWCSRRRPNKPYQADSSVFFAPRPQWPQCPVFCAFAGRPRGRAARRGRRSGGTPGTPGVSSYNSWPTRGEGRGVGGSLRRRLASPGQELGVAAAKRPGCPDVGRGRDEARRPPDLENLAGPLARRKEKTIDVRARGLTEEGGGRGKGISKGHRHDVKECETTASVGD